ncbi:hypothetical protein ASPTUDRAFT_53324 [Aspergillus tubingensis CBS 134.48]|uniref:Uncharacterized protein n=1 Tax=Aspergillus tubingensis (strain CBS 134.48) TaxID=767770 RepID=A0A1L9N9P4_ASPTC|nr:hypothetical protein ASPTUDRAFT_53324 [Aspergillus tubingensis CBS 134.48]
MFKVISTARKQARSPCRDITTQTVNLITHLHRKAALCRCKAEWRWPTLPMRVSPETPVEAGYSAHELPFWSTMGR